MSAVNPYYLSAYGTPDIDSRGIVDVSTPRDYKRLSRGITTCCAALAF